MIPLKRASRHSAGQQFKRLQQEDTQFSAPHELLHREKCSAFAPSKLGVVPVSIVHELRKAKISIAGICRRFGDSHLRLGKGSSSPHPVPACGIATAKVHSSAGESSGRLWRHVRKSGVLLRARLFFATSASIRFLASLQSEWTSKCRCCEYKRF